MTNWCTASDIDLRRRIGQVWSCKRPKFTVMLNVYPSATRTALSSVDYLHLTLCTSITKWYFLSSTKFAQMWCILKEMSTKNSIHYIEKSYLIRPANIPNPHNYEKHTLPTRYRSYDEIAISMHRTSTRPYCHWRNRTMHCCVVSPIVHAMLLSITS